MPLDAIFQPRPMTIRQQPDYKPEDNFDAFAGGRPRGIMLHRTNAVDARPDLFVANSPADVRKYYQSLDPTWRMPFALHIAPNGQVTQCVSLDRQTPHARAGNATHVGVCCIGDFRQKEGHDMPSAQLGALVGVCAHLAQCGFVDMEDAQWLVSHDGDPSWSSMRDLESPGKRLPLDQVKLLVQGQMLHAIEGLSLRLSSNSEVRSNEIAPRTRAAEARLWQGHLQEAFDELQALRPLVGAADPRATLALNMARAKQFAGSKALRQKQDSAPFFEAALQLLKEAEATARAPALKDAIRLQQLQTRRAAAGDQVDEALLKDFVAFQSELKLSHRMPSVVAFVDYLRGNLESAEQGYMAVLAQRDSWPNGLARCRLGQVQLAAGKHREAVSNLQAGLSALGYFPEKTKMAEDAQRAQLLLQHAA